MKLICGLGNPGREYEAHRHNVGFLVVDALSTRLRTSLDQEKFEGRLGTTTVGDDKLLLLQPQTFMNVSGRCVAPLARFYKIPVENILVIHDELDLPFGRLQLKKGGGSGGHNGLKSVSECLGQPDYARLRFGIDKPKGENAKERVPGYVLSPFSKGEASALEPLLDMAAEACEAWARQGLAEAMNRFNRKTSLE